MPNNKSNKSNKSNTIKIPKRYIPKGLTKKDKLKQKREILRSRRGYRRTNNKRKYYTRKKISSFKSKKSPHVINAMKMYKVDNVKPSKELAKKTKCSLKSLKKMMKKGQGAYFSSGSRPNQTAHSWGVARLASAITGGKASAVDYHILKDGCKPSSKALKLATSQRKKYKYGRRRIAKRMVGGKKSTYRMKETLVGFEKASNPKKKYTATVRDKKTHKTRKLHFGASDYPQYRDSTPLGLYKKKNHGDFKRMQRYYSRHSGTKHRIEAIEKEKKVSKGYYTPKILSHVYLW